MTSIMLNAIHMQRQSKSYIDSLYTILTAAGLFDGPKYMLSGLTGMAFKFTVHEKLLPLSVSAYGQWGNEHNPAIANLGLFTIWDGGRSRHPTFPHYQKDAVNWVKASLDAGIGVIYWIPEFGVIYGYDDEDAVFYVQDGSSAESEVVLYDNFGLNFTSFWYAQSFGERVQIPLRDMVLESIRLAVHDWDTPHKTLPDTDLASGKLAFTYLIDGLRKGAYDEGGAVYIMNDYIYTRGEVAAYLHDVQHTLPGLDQAAAAYASLRTVLAAAAECFHTGAEGTRVHPARIEQLCSIMQQAAMLEQQAMTICRSIADQYPDRKRSTLPRWGSHTPR
ncbi:BtrH N-terminal domain-containing protein [Paenibacillus sp. R14(2021)]|uniref:BtrH N-terminal domain-containing protein n=1 Tax=Paenibacillus sp. R14(2021) TaxID=2859228 RepID=UPI001C615F92|nr:BtrH N-terminal domain-containing protein [Paenibacillus sp. R14(2021)]